VAAGTFIAQSERLPAQVWLTRLIPQTQLHAGTILAVILAGAVYIFLWRTTIGYRLRAVGQNPEAARYAGIRVPVYQVLALTLAGGFAGLAGGVEILGVHHRLLEGISSGYGFTGIVAALFGKLHPLGLVPAAFIFGSLLVGANKMQRAVQVPSALVGTLLGVVVLFVVGSDWWVRRRAARRSTPEAESEVTAHE
jgi:simple sugar transport system permease protein